MDWSRTRFVAEFADLGNACDVAEEVEARFGLDACTVALGGAGRDTAASLYVNTANDRHEAALAYAHELIEAARVGRDAYLEAIERGRPARQQP